MISKLLDNRVLVKRIQNPDKIGRIYIPQSATSKPDPEKGIVVAIGPGKAITSIAERTDIKEFRIPMQVKVGDIVLYNRFVAIQLDDKEDLLVMHESDIFCILEE